MPKCDCLDGAYDSCDICCPPSERGWMQRQFRQVKADTLAVGGSWEPHNMIAHAHKQKKEIAKLRRVLRYFLKYGHMQHPPSIAMAEKALKRPKRSTPA
jgi:hypothetical protein